MDCLYFYIASHAKPLLVVDIGEQQGQVIPLVLRTNDGRASQLWQWKCDATIINKGEDFVLDVKRSLKKAGRIAIVDSKKDSVNQGWYVIDEHIISNRYNLALDVKGHSVSTEMGLHVNDINDKPSQKWVFVPEYAWQDFQRAYENPDILEKAQYWQCVATNYIHVIMGCTFDEYKDHVTLCTSTIDECADKLDSVTTDIGITKTVGGSAAIIGGTAMVGGLVLAPFTAGTSLLLTVGGAVTSVLGGATTLTANIVDQVWEKVKKDKVKRAITPAITATLNLQNFLNSHHTSLEKARTFLKTPKGSKLAQNIVRGPKNAAMAGYTSFAIGKTAYKGIKHAKNFTTISKLVSPIDDSVSVLRAGAAAEAAAPGLRVFGKSVVTTGSTAAKGLSGSLAVVGIAFGIWDVYSGAKQISNKSDLAQEFRESAKNIADSADNFVNMYYQIVANDSDGSNDSDDSYSSTDSDDGGGETGVGDLNGALRTT